MATNSDNMDAINVYFRTTPIPPRNAEAFQIKDAFIRWWDSNIRDSWWNKAMSQSAYDEARTRRNQFNIALQPTAQKKEEIRQVLARGIESEEIEGGAKPAFDAQTGRVGTQVKKPTVAATPSTRPTQGQPLAPSPSGNAPVALTRVLALGTTDSGKGDVKAWQTKLGIVPPTGTYGPTTVERTKAWQSAWNKAHPNDLLKVDGKVGQETWKRAFPGGMNVAPSGNEFAPPVVEPRAEDLFAPSPVAKSVSKPATQKTASKPTTQKPVSKPATVVEKTKEVAKTSVSKVQQAGIINVGTWPLWAKVAGIMTIVAAAIAGAKGKNPLRIGG